MSRIKFDVRYKELSSLGYKAEDISNKDLNDMMYSGIFYGFNIGNSPDENYVEIIVTRHSDTWIVQECKDYIDRIYLRSYKNGMWSGWTQLIVEHDCDNPNTEVIIVERPHTHAVATPQSDGFMSAADKRKLDALTDQGTSDGSDHRHLEYEQDIADINDRITELDKQKSNIDHNHDERYIPVFSSIRPSTQDVAGQVWIETN